MKLRLFDIKIKLKWFPSPFPILPGSFGRIPANHNSAQNNILQAGSGCPLYLHAVVVFRKRENLDFGVEDAASIPCAFSSRSENSATKHPIFSSRKKIIS